MPADDELNERQRLLLEDVRMLGQLRRCSNALRHGELVTIEVTEDVYAYIRDVGDEWPVLALDV